MKRSLFIAIAVLIVMALFVGCKAEIADRDELGMVSISGPSRAVDSTSENTVSVEGLYWYYTAVKADASMFTTGATGTTKTAVKAGKGIVDAPLGRFSTGAWTFCFYGYEAEYNPSDASQKPVFSQTGVSVTVAKNTNTSIELTLVKGEGYSKTAKIAIVGATWYYQYAGTGKALTLNVYDGNATTPLTTLAAETDDGTATFSTETATEFTLEEGEHTLRFEVTYDANENQLVGSTTYPIVVAGGYKYTITNLSDTSAGIETVDENGAIVISGQYDVETGAATASGSISAATSTENTIVAEIAPVSEVSATVNPTTTVSFPAGALTAGEQYTLDVETTPIGNVPTSITITEGEAFVAGINLTLNNGAVKTFNGEEVTIVTYIAKGLDKTKLAVCYNGNGEQPELVDYDPTTGELEFTTTHFSEFYVKSTEIIVAAIDNYIYGSLEAAIAATPENVETTIVVLKDVVIAGNAGITIPNGKNIILDLNGFTVKNAVDEDKTSQVIANNGILTIKDSSDNEKNGTGSGVLTNSVNEGTNGGEWYSEPKRNYVTAVINNFGTLTIESGRIENTGYGSICYAIDSNSGTRDAILTINGGYITSSGTVMRLFCNSVTNKNTLNMTSGTIYANGSTGFWIQLPGSQGQAKQAALNISGGTITGSTYAFYDYSFGDVFDNVNYIITGGTFNGGIYSYGANSFVITGGEFNGFISSDDDIEVSGGSFSDSSVFDYLVDGASIKLLNNVTLEGPIELTNGTIDLNGYTIDTEYYLDFYGTSTIKNGTVNYLAENDGKCAIWANADGKLTVESVEVNSKTADDKTAYAVSMWGSGAELVINSGVFNGYVGTNGQLRNEVVTINGGTFAHGC